MGDKYLSILTGFLIVHMRGELHFVMSNHQRDYIQLNITIQIKITISRSGIVMTKQIKRLSLLIGFLTYNSELLFYLFDIISLMDRILTQLDASNSF